MQEDGLLERGRATRARDLGLCWEELLHLRGRKKRNQQRRRRFDIREVKGKAGKSWNLKDEEPGFQRDSITASVLVRRMKMKDTAWDLARRVTGDLSRE